MPKILTDAYRDATFFVTYNEDKTEGVYLKPLTDTMKGKLRNEAQKEAGADDAQTGAILVRKMIQESVQDWKGFYDMAGAEIPCDKEHIKEICECDSEIAAGLMFRIQNVARMGELEERKN